MSGPGGRQRKSNQDAEGGGLRVDLKWWEGGEDEKDLHPSRKLSPGGFVNIFLSIVLI